MSDEAMPKSRAFFWAMIDAIRAHHRGDREECQNALGYAALLTEDDEDRINRLADFCKERGYQ